MKQLLIFLGSLTIMGGLAACSKDSPTQETPPIEEPTLTNSILVDSLATAETVALFQNLQAIAQTGVLFGHQDDTAYGIGWEATPGSSDVKKVCGDYPAVYGWDLGDIGQPTNLDGVSFDLIKQRIIEAYERGGINTISMHLDNPVTGGNAWDNSPAVAAILPGGSQYASYVQTLDLIADFLNDLETSDGTKIPIIFRPYHEHNHTWSWWGRSACSVSEYNALWKMTVEYLRDTKKLHHLLYAISPQEIRSEAEYLERYPGDDYVDILGMDYYQLWDKNAVPRLAEALSVMADIAAERGKVSALTEVGIDRVPISNWWTQYLLAALTYNDGAKRTAWALVWRNDSKDHHFAPYPGHRSAADFQAFYADPFTVFEQDLPEMYE